MPFHLPPAIQKHPVLLQIDTAHERAIDCLQAILGVHIRASWVTQCCGPETSFDDLIEDMKRLCFAVDSLSHSIDQIGEYFINATGDAVGISGDATADCWHNAIQAKSFSVLSRWIRFNIGFSVHQESKSVSLSRSVLDNERIPIAESLKGCYSMDDHSKLESNARVEFIKAKRLAIGDLRETTTTSEVGKKRGRKETKQENAEKLYNAERRLIEDGILRPTNAQIGEYFRTLYRKDPPGKSQLNELINLGRKQFRKT